MSSPPDRVVTDVHQRRSTILDVIGGARHELMLSLFRCKDREVFAALTQAVTRGVAVHVLVTARAKGDRKKLDRLHQSLNETGAIVSTYHDPVVKYHAKYLVADEGPAIVASLNITKKCLTKTLDALVVTHDPEVVSGLRRLMAADRNGVTLPEALSRRLIIGPERARAQFTDIIDSAQRTIRLVDAKLSDPDVVARFDAKRAAGVTVEIFRAKRIGRLRSHGKMLLVDDRVAVIGSLALAALSLDFRREVAIVVEDPAAVAEVGQFFDRLSAPSADSVVSLEG
jgi:phosphatidylserine/phosphatidylglycerophosphate/cardiolipin synthase-like enzyme